MFLICFRFVLIIYQAGDVNRRRCATKREWIWAMDQVLWTMYIVHVVLGPYTWCSPTTCTTPSIPGVIVYVLPLHVLHHLFHGPFLYLLARSSHLLRERDRQPCEKRNRKKWFIDRKLGIKQITRQVSQYHTSSSLVTQREENELGHGSREKECP